MAFDDMDVTVGPARESWRTREERPRPPRPGVTTRWPTEQHARRALEETLAPYDLVLVPEVRLKERGGTYLYIDYVALCPKPWPARAIGIEVKSGFDKLAHGLDVVRQAELYRKALVSDNRVACALGQPLEHVFIWPGLNWRDDCSHEAGARAIRALAGRRNIGSIDVDYVWRYNEHHEDARWMRRVRFTEGQMAYWTSSGFDMLDGYFGAAANRPPDPSRGMRAVE